MRRLLISVGLLLIPSVIFAQVTANVFLRVFRIQSGDRAGTAFTVEVDGHQYVITARHTFKRPEVNVDVKLFLTDGSWHPFKARAIYPENNSVDTVALDVGKKVTVEWSFEPTAGDIVLGQQVYFVGYPTGLSSKGGLPGDVAEFPFIKSGILSAIDSRIKDSVIFFVDGQNNPGFSGGPIVFRCKESGEFRVAAVVTAYQTEAFPVLKKKDFKNLNAIAYKDLWTRGNSGIVVGYNIQHIADAIRKDAIHQQKTGNR
jgi:hypothetical protein